MSDHQSRGRQSRDLARAREGRVPLHGAIALGSAHGRGEAAASRGPPSATEPRQLRDRYRTYGAAPCATRDTRHATIDVRAKLVTLRFAKRKNQPLETLTLTAVWFRELNAEGGEPIDWLPLHERAGDQRRAGERDRRQLLPAMADRAVSSHVEAAEVRECNIEDAQLRSQEAVVKWATILAAVATRIERLKYLSLNKPDQPASTELAPLEIEALKLDQRQRRPGSKKRKLPGMPTIYEATHWIAVLDGWIGMANGPPGAAAIARRPWGGHDTEQALSGRATLRPYQSTEIKRMRSASPPTVMLLCSRRRIGRAGWARRTARSMTSD